MGNINVCYNEKIRSTSKTWPQGSLINKVILEVSLNFKDLNLCLLSGYCAREKTDVTINVSDEYVSKNGTEQEKFLFSKGGKDLIQETAEFIAKNKKLHYKFPFYTHGGNLEVSNVIHITLSQDKNIIKDSEIEKILVDCFMLADQELEATSISLPMFQVKTISSSRIAKIVIQSVKTYLVKVQQKNKHNKLTSIKIIGEDPKIQTAYIQAVQRLFGPSIKLISSSRKVSDQLSHLQEQKLSAEEYQMSYVPSFNSERAVNYTSKDFHMQFD